MGGGDVYSVVGFWPRIWAVGCCKFSYVLNFSVASFGFHSPTEGRTKVLRTRKKSHRQTKWPQQGFCSAKKALQILSHNLALHNSPKKPSTELHLNLKIIP